MTQVIYSIPADWTETEISHSFSNISLIHVYKDIVPSFYNVHIVDVGNVISIV